MHRQLRRLLVPFLAPALVLYGVLFLWPAIQAVAASLTAWSGISSEKPFIGLGNYVSLLQDSHAIQTAWNTFALIIITGLLTVPLTFYFVLVTENASRRSRFLRFVVVAPMAVSIAAVAFVWKFVYDPNFGLLNAVLHAASLDGLATAWLGNERTALIAVAVTIVWGGTGIWVLFVAAAVARVPAELKDSARIDGAGSWQVFRHVTFPLIWEVVRVLVVIFIIFLSQQFLFVLAMTKGGPYGSTNVVGNYVYSLAFESQQWGYANAFAVVWLVFTLGFVGLAIWLTRRPAVEYD